MALLTFVGVALQAFDQFVENSDKQSMRRAVENFWFSTAELNTDGSVGTALSSRYKQIKRNIPRFLRLYWLMLLIMFIIICVENHNRNAAELKNDFKLSTTVDFSVLANTYYIEASRDLQTFCVGHHDECVRFGGDIAWRHEVSRIARLEDSYNDLLIDFEQKKPIFLELAADMTAAIVIVLLVIPLSFSLLLSFNCTLWLISSITSSSWKLFVILLVDALVTLIAPAVLLNIFIYFGIQAGVYIAGGLVDYSSFNSANILTLSMGLAAYLINLSFIGLTGTSWFMYMTPDWIARLIVFVIQLFFLGLNIYHTVAGFVFDTWKAVHFDFSTGYVAGTINWAIVVDIFYSAVFLIPGLLIVLVQRWAFGQRMVLNCIQLIAEHPIGPVYAIGSGLSWLAGATAKLFTGK